ncbi:MAG TPA: hypothetical protein VK726_25095 [Acetobacteraceae bacterium]|jgi:hypothetical protein|nr:hypothetical protein [Acetobacteraceae bacterium]
MKGNDLRRRWPRVLAVLALATSLGGCAAYGGDYDTAYDTGWNDPGIYDTYPNGGYFAWAGGAFGHDRDHGGWHDTGWHAGGSHAGWHTGGMHLGDAGHVGVSHVGGHMGGFGGHAGGFGGHGGGGRA